ncbi:MAG: metallopeptidase family protein [Kiritimatiellae bacterium]|nr:metallopeptidase family protein [Kiritimatiellia bacterium]MCO5068056.1 metallopeptidase family protein [Kiritimatiellia bacterium]
MPQPDPHFHHLLATAEQEVQHTLRALPTPLRAKANRIPILYERIPSPAIQAEQIEADTLGLFIGETYPDAYAGAHHLPAQIILYLENIWDYANQDPHIYREEVRRTLLHELGHYLGLDEDDLADRELD